MIPLTFLALDWIFSRELSIDLAIRPAIEVSTGKFWRG
jgi:hypothetical protein